MKTAVIGYLQKENQQSLKEVVNKYLAGTISGADLAMETKALRRKYWLDQDNQQIEFISANDFSLYDQVLDTACLLNIIPKRFSALKSNSWDQYLAMAFGNEIQPLAKKQWFNTSHFYLVPEIDDDVEIKLIGTKLFNEFQEALALGIKTKPALIGPYTLLKLVKFTGSLKIADILADIIDVYQEIILKLGQMNANWIQFDEPALVLEMNNDDLALLENIYQSLLVNKGAVKILLQTYFGDVHSCYNSLLKLPVDGLGLDFVEGIKNIELIETYGFNQAKYLFAGVIDGKHTSKNNYAKTIDLLEKLNAVASEVIISTSCSLQYLDTTNDEYIEKLRELFQLKIINDFGKEHCYYDDNVAFFKK